MRYISNKWSVLLVAVVMVAFMTIIAMFLLERAQPFAENVRWVDQSNEAYYRGVSAIERALDDMEKFSPGDTHGDVENIEKDTRAYYDYSVVSKSLTVPAIDSGNSEFDRDFNRVGPQDPVEIPVVSGITWDGAKIEFKIPDIKETEDQDIVGSASDPVVFWALTSNKEVDGNIRMLFARPSEDVDKIFGCPSGHELCKADDFFDVAHIGGEQNISQKIGQILNNNIQTMNIRDFYTSQLSSCSEAWVKCALRLSTVKELITREGGAGEVTTFIPYLEYRLVLPGSSEEIPTPFAQVTATGKVADYHRTIERVVPQNIATGGFDFTLFN